MRMFKKHHHLTPLHRYQLEVVLLFIVGLFLYLPYIGVLTIYGLDTHEWQWYFFWIWLIGYSMYSLYCRSQIPRSEAIDPTHRPLMHWILLGITLFVIHLQPINTAYFESLDLMFGVFSLFLADSYWDFKKRRA